MTWVGIIPLMNKPALKVALESKPPKSNSLEAAAETIRLLHETLATLTEQSRQLAATQKAGAHARILEKIRSKK
jgi:hypothetical protein